MPNFYLMLWIIFIVIPPSVSKCQELEIAGANDINIIPYLKEFKDCSRKATVDDVLNAVRENKLKTLPMAKVVNRGISTCTHWFVLILKNGSSDPQEYLWSFYNDGISFSLYEVDSTFTSVIDSSHLSHLTNIDQRPYQLRSISFPIQMLPNETKYLILKPALYGRQNLYFPTDISTVSDVLSYELKSSFLLGGYYGFFAFAIVFNLCLFVVLKRRFYLYMLGYVVALLLFNLVEYLHDAYIIPGIVYPYWVLLPKSAFLGFAMIFNALVFIDFTRHDQYFPTLTRFIVWGNYALLATIVCFIVAGQLSQTHTQAVIWIQQIFFYSLMLQGANTLANLLIATWCRTPYIFLYLIGNSLVFISFILYLINSLNILYIPQFVRPGNIIFAFCVECIYLMIAFTVKYRKEIREYVGRIVAGEKHRQYLAKELITAQENERLRIAQDIHDGVGGSLQALRLMLTNEELKKKAQVTKLLKSINDDFRRLVNMLTPRNIEFHGLFEAIKTEVNTFSHDVEVIVDTIGSDAGLRKDLMITLFRVFQELMTNVVKHGKNVSKIMVQLAIDEEEIRLLVENDGVQTDVFATKEGEGMGFRNMRSRVQYYNGTLHIENSTYTFTVIITIPNQSEL